MKCSLQSVYSDPDYIVDDSKFIWGPYKSIHLLYVPVKIMAYICTLMDLYVTGTCTVITCEVDTVVGGI